MSNAGEWTDLDRPLVIKTGPRPESAVVQWKGQPIPWLRRLTVRWNAVPEIELGGPNDNKNLTEVDPANEGDHAKRLSDLRVRRDQIAREIRNAGFEVNIV